MKRLRTDGPFTGLSGRASWALDRALTDRPDIKGWQGLNPDEMRWLLRFLPAEFWLHLREYRNCGSKTVGEILGWSGISPDARPVKSVTEFRVSTLLAQVGISGASFRVKLLGKGEDAVVSVISWDLSRP